MRIYIMRHADPDYARDALTPAGREEARALAQYLQSLPIDEIYASPLGRTRATAGYTADLLDLPVRTEPWLRELEQVWIQDLDRAFLKISPLDESVELEPVGGLRLYQNDPCLMQENMERIRAGSDAFLRRQGYAREGDIYRVTRANAPDRGVAVFTHMGVGLVWLAHLLSVPLPLVWSGFFLHPASVTTVVMDERAPGYAAPRCIGLGDISHLCRAGIAPRPVGMAMKA